MKTNYDRICLQTLQTLGNSKPRLLLHACCAPCACWPLEMLLPYFTITILYNNSNIYPPKEYQRRLEELRRYLARRNASLKNPVQLLVLPYANEEYTAKLRPYRDEPERGKRCWLCYALRLQEGFAKAEVLNMDYFTTVMTVSRQKDSQRINEIARQLADRYPKVKYLYSDFKKRDGILKGNALAREAGLYRQNYCGCLYSYQQRHAQSKPDESS